MKTLYSIVESRGIVTGEDSWSDLVKHIAARVSQYLRKPVVTHLPNWIHSVVLDTSNNAYWGIASYDDSQSEIIDHKLKVVIHINKEVIKQSPIKLRVTLEHELQHAYDDYIARVKRNVQSFMSDRYCIGTGYEMDENASYLRLGDDPKNCNCDNFFILFKQFTYFFEPTETNAYLREFKLYLDKHLNHNDIDYNQIISEPEMGNQCGGILLQFIHIVYDVIDNIEHDVYIEDDDHVDYDYIVMGLNSHWAEQYLGRKVSGANSKQFVIDTIKKILDKRGKYTMDKLKRIIKDTQNSKYKLKNIPTFLK